MRPDLNDCVRWGIVGCGAVTEVKSGPAFQVCQGSKLVAVMRRDAELAADYAKRHGVPKWYSDVDALINDSEVDAVYIATPPCFHASYALKALRAGKPAYVEKPLDASYLSAAKLVSEAQKLQVPLFSAYYRRAMPYFTFIKDYIDSGKGGKPISVQLTYCRPVEEGHGWHMNPAISGGGLFHDLACHELDVLDYLLGPVERVHGAHSRGEQSPADDMISGQFSFQNGVQGVALFNYHSFHTVDEIVIEMEKACVRFSCFQNTSVEIISSEGAETHSFSPLAHVQQPMVQNVVDSLLGKAEPLSTGISALRTQRVMALLTDEKVD